LLDALSYPFRAPIGYRDEGGGKVKSVDPIKAPLVKELFRLYLTGDYSLNSLTIEMQRRGLTGYYGKPVVRRNVETILKTPYYCGQILVMGKLYKGIHTPLITVAEFRRVQAIKANRSGKKSTKHRHLLRGLVQCDHCKRTLTGETQKGRVYYRCHTQGCHGKPIREDRLETQVINALQNMEISPKDQKHLKEQLRSWIEKGGQHDLEKSIKLRISEAQAKQDRLTDLLVDDAIDKAAFILRKDNFTFEVEQLRGELATIQKSKMGIEDFEQAVCYATSLSKSYDCADPVAKRQVLKNSFARLGVGSGELVCEPAMWLQQLTRGGGATAKGVDIQTAVACLRGRELQNSELSIPTQA